MNTLNIKFYLRNANNWYKKIRLYYLWNAKNVSAEDSFTLNFKTFLESAKTKGQLDFKRHMGTIWAWNGEELKTLNLATMLRTNVQCFSFQGESKERECNLRFPGTGDA